jgi:hypothetical protein
VILPNIERAVIPEEKLRDYLLAPTHLVGRHKAAYFRALGYTQENWKALESDLRRFLREDAREKEITKYGTKFEIQSQIDGPAGRSARIITAWIVLRGEDFPRFITAHPG